MLKEEFVNSDLKLRSVRQNHESEAGNETADVECYQCVCPTGWM